MRRIGHISDLHFGALDERTVEPLLRALHDLDLDLIAVSGDLTQRARRAQFRDARAFLERLPARPRVVVPGNHDIPLWDVARRFLRTRKRFDRFVTRARYPRHIDDTVAMVGVNTARALAVANGRVGRRQLRTVRRVLRAAAPRALRVVVAHHPFVVPDEAGLDRVLGARRALTAFANLGVDVLLTGHGHNSWVGHDGRTLVVHAGTSTSSRRRGETNAFNVVEVEPREVRVRRFAFDPDARRFSPDGDPHREPRATRGG